MKRDSRRCALRLGHVSRGSEKKGEGVQIAGHLKSLLLVCVWGGCHVLLVELPPHRWREGWEGGSLPNKVMDKNYKKIAKNKNEISFVCIKQVT